jgi:preprotein translocase subunit YajC
MTPETEFFLKIMLTMVFSGIIWMIMLKLQRKKEQEANEKYEFTIKLVEMRNKKIEDKNEPKKKT